MVKELVAINFATVTLILCLLIFILTNIYFSRHVRMLFLVSCFMVLCLVTVDSIEYWTASLDTFLPLRIWMSAIGYSLRPAVIYVVILLLLRQRKEQRIWLCIPLFINALIAFSALFTDIAYSYSEDNQFIRGPIGYFAFVTSGFYAVVLLICTIKLYKSTHLSEAMIAVAAICSFVISTVLESVYKFEGFINITGAVSLVFYYLYLNTQQFKRDPMTNALNRRCFYMDGEKNIENLTAILSIDMNNLKQLNDKYGHAKGDEAICTLVLCIDEILPRKCYLYRIGGDEFMVLCINQNKSDIESLVSNIRNEISKNQLSCAIGVAYRQWNQDINSLCSQADKAMYDEKLRMKKA